MPQTALHRAISYWQDWLIDALLERDNVDIDEQDDEGQTPLFLAAATGQYEIVKDLAARGANLFITNNRGLTPLDRALQLSFHLEETVDTLLYYGAAFALDFDHSLFASLKWALDNTETIYPAFDAKNIPEQYQNRFMTTCKDYMDFYYGEERYGTEPDYEEALLFQAKHALELHYDSSELPELNEFVAEMERTESPVLSL